MAFERVLLRTTGGQEFGPVSMAEVMDWHAQGRVPPDAGLVDADTGEVRPVAAFPALAIPPPPNMTTPLAAGSTANITAADRLIPIKNPLALTSYYCGIFGIIPCVTPILGPLALIFGLMGLRSSKQLNVGGGHAWAGIILGGIECLVLLAGIVLWITGAIVSK